MRLELEEAAQPFDLVQVDAHALGEQQPAPLLDDGERAERGVERLAQGVGLADRHEPVLAGPRARLVRAPVLDQLGVARRLLAQLEPAADAVEVGVALRDLAVVLGAERRARAPASAPGRGREP